MSIKGTLTDNLSLRILRSRECACHNSLVGIAGRSGVSNGKHGVWLAILPVFLFKKQVGEWGEKEERKPRTKKIRNKFLPVMVKLGEVMPSLWKGINPPTI